MVSTEPPSKIESNTNGEVAEPEESVVLETLGHAPRTVHGVKWALIVIATLSSLLLYAFDNTIVANIVPSIVNDLGSVEKLPWLSVGLVFHRPVPSNYSLTITRFLIGGLCATLPFGRLYGIYDTKILYCISLILFFGGSALCGGAPSMTAIIIGRAIAGIGGNGMYIGVVTLLSVNTTDVERPIGLVYGIGTVVGPIIGGAFADSSATWRWGFYFNLVIGGVFSPVYLIILPSQKPLRSIADKSPLKSFDYVGAVLQAGSLASITMAINFGGTLYPWKSGQIIALFVISGLLLVAFIAQQELNIFTTVGARIFPIHFMRKKEPVLLALLMLANNAGTFVLIYYIPLYFQFTKGQRALKSGVELLPLIILITATIMLNGGILSKTGLYKPWYLVGSVLVLVGGVLISRTDLQTSTARIYGYQVILGVGLGGYLQSGYAIIQSILSPSDVAYAVSFMLTAQLLGLVFALSISGAVFTNSTLSNLQKLLPDIPRGELQNAISGLSGNFFGSLSPELQGECLLIIMSSLQKVYILVYVAGAVSLVAAMFLSNKRMNLGSTNSA
ncbi:hypothetical protein HYFRA_00002988 [Hymenoscyphus fraxineus]|uniref:Major facilitator superfamily (MFS) profile domain-containing protein n=1 Tax=Hymenoscyphus fraxineus TaxID=746836 RepID=A0A9N9KN18_9HELO|nr:hypothetical protein HYFRA_00002988 [Hymenoscyphus fraxineus]